MSKNPFAAFQEQSEPFQAKPVKEAPKKQEQANNSKQTIGKKERILFKNICKEYFRKCNIHIEIIHLHKCNILTTFP